MNEYFSWRTLTGLIGFCILLQGLSLGFFSYKRNDIPYRILLFMSTLSTIIISFTLLYYSFTSIIPNETYLVITTLILVAITIFILQRLPELLIVRSYKEISKTNAILLIELEARRTALEGVLELQKQAQKVSKEFGNKADYEALANNIPQLVWVTNNEGEVLYFNRAWDAYLKIDKNQSLTKAWIEAVHPNDLQHTIDTWQTALKSESEYDVTYKLKKIDGTYVSIVSRGNPVRAEDCKVLRWIGTCTPL